MTKTNQNPNQSPAEFFGWERNPFIDLPGDVTIKNLVVKQDSGIAYRACELIKVTRSFAVIGTPGVGKTTLIKAVMQSLDLRSYRPIWLSYAGCNRSGVMRILADKIGLELTRKGLPPLHKLQRHLANLQKEAGSPFPVIVVDDAQNLEPESLMDLCAIIAHPEEQRALASLILIGDETLERTLRLDSRRAIASRMACILKVESLTQDETKALIQARIERANAPDALFDDDALELLALHSRGNRRELMNLAINMCIEAHALKEKVITAELVIAKTNVQ